MLSEQAKEARREYKRKWTARNPDKVKAAMERYWERRAASEAAQTEEEKISPVETPLQPEEMNDDL